MDSEKVKVNVGAIGAGYWGPNLIRNFVEMGRAELVALADLDLDRLDSLQRRYPGIQVMTTDYHDLFKMADLDAVVIATPPATHYEIARDCLQAGLHVMIEKPMALNSRDAEALVEMATQLNLKLMVGHTFEYNAAVRALKDIIDSGEIGEIYYIDAVRTNLGLFQTRANVMWDLAPHDVSILHYLMDETPESVNAVGGHHILESIYDVIYMHMNFSQGRKAHIRLSWLDPQKVRQITIVGSNKMVVFNDVEPLEKIKIYDKGVNRPSYTETYKEFEFSYRYGDIVIPNISFIEPLRVECEHFVDCVLMGDVPQSDGISGLNVVRVLEAADRSLSSCGAVVQLAQVKTPSVSNRHHVG